LVRSPFAHALVNGIDPSDATAIPGVRGVFTAVDAAEVVAVDYDPLARAVDPERALESDAALLFADVGTNLAHEFRRTSGPDVLAGADVVIRGRFLNQRLAAIPMETNGALADLPSFEAENTDTPTPLNPLGAKGIGEAATVGSMPAIQSAVIDAVSHLGIRHIDMSLTPERVWRAVREALARLGIPEGS
jgi:CO/xanthine dehydrogenase Mo-binding subunit